MSVAESVGKKGNRNRHANRNRDLSAANEKRLRNKREYYRQVFDAVEKLIEAPHKFPTGVRRFARFLNEQVPQLPAPRGGKWQSASAQRLLEDWLLQKRNAAAFAHHILNTSRY